VDKIFKAFADKNRRKILTLLKSQEMTVNGMLKFMDIGQATLSTHLSILKKVGMVTCRVNGKNRIYKLSRDVLISFVTELNRFVNFEGVKVKDEIIVRRIND
jgi:ArsR family transcriptional regulator, arsenate/arsenite/antimonite-responsive transcriptional repressor